MKLSFTVFACALGLANLRTTQGHNDHEARQLRPAVQVNNSVYVGKDFGFGCGRLGKKSVADSTKAGLVYCFEVVNTGNTRLNNVVVTNPDLGNFFDNSINHLEPGQSKIVPFIHTLSGDLVNNVVVTATPVHPDGTPIVDNHGAGVITATDRSEVIDVIARSRKLQADSRQGYASPVVGKSNCIQSAWEEAGNSDELICAQRDVYLTEVSAAEDATCIAGGEVQVTIDASVMLAVSVLHDLGWYIDTAPGGDAMQGSECVANGLMESNDYSVVIAKQRDIPFGEVKWHAEVTDDFTTRQADDQFDFGAGAKLDKVPKEPKTDRRRHRRHLQKKKANHRRNLQQSIGGGGAPSLSLMDDNVGDFTDNASIMDGGDGDECGDVYLHGEDEALIRIPIAVSITLSCEDQNEDNALDFPICFTWRQNGLAECKFESNIPETTTGSCYCSRYDVPNVEVIVVTKAPVNDTALLC